MIIYKIAPDVLFAPDAHMYRSKKPLPSVIFLNEDTKILQRTVSAVKKKSGLQI